MESCEHLSPDNVRDSLYNTLIYKDECMKCYSNPDHADGLNVCLKCLQGFCLDMGHTQHHLDKTGHSIVLNIKKIPKDPNAEENKITKLAIGKEGGANIQDNFNVFATLHCLKCQKELDTSGAYIAPIVESILNSKSAFFQSQVGEWEQEIKECEHTRGLDQTGAQMIANKALAHCGQ